MSILTVYYCPYKQIIEQFGKKFPVTNTLAYISAASVTNKKSFITLTPGTTRSQIPFRPRPVVVVVVAVVVKLLFHFPFLVKTWRKKLDG
jgi:hypothetical protein